MCVALPARVREVRGTTALVETGGRVQEVSILPVPEVRPGDWVLLSLGMAVKRIPPEVARDLLALWGEADARMGGEAR